MILGASQWEDHDEDDDYLNILRMMMIKIARSDDDQDISDCPNVLWTVDKFTLTNLLVHYLTLSFDQWSQFLVFQSLQSPTLGPKACTISKM